MSKKHTLTVTFGTKKKQETKTHNNLTQEEAIKFIAHYATNYEFVMFHGNKKTAHQNA